MNQVKRLLLIVLCGASLYSCVKSLVDADIQPLSAATPQIMVHYMPWYASKSVSGEWGWHWTMNHFDPDTIADDGRREIASHYYPLIGPYDSNDPHALECHVLLMKFAGIDGAIIDWYGIKDHYDYAAIHRNTNHLIAYIKKAGLSFAICYEDQTVKHLVNDGIIRESEALSHGKEVLRWMQDHWFIADEYAKIAGRPLLLVFGPQYFKGASWKELFSGLSQPPYFYTLNSLQEGADGVFGWPPVHGDRVVSPDNWRAYLSQLYEQGGIGTAFPKFHDIYEEAGVRESYGYLDDQEGAVFWRDVRTRRSARVANPDRHLERLRRGHHNRADGRVRLSLSRSDTELPQKASRQNLSVQRRRSAAAHRPIPASPASSRGRAGGHTSRQRIRTSVRVGD